MIHCLVSHSFRCAAPVQLAFSPVGAWFWKHIDTAKRNRMPSLTVCPATYSHV